MVVVPYADGEYHSASDFWRGNLGPLSSKISADGGSANFGHDSANHDHGEVQGAGLKGNSAQEDNDTQNKGQSTSLMPDKLPRDEEVANDIAQADHTSHDAFPPTGQVEVIAEF
ncbi:hypothetical protein AYO21_04108 [Fonsecaea monophora]|uniref:Uncharacterized protein n=1 Tax=Fonsecaea monophora TaxID=254056 RepID=A0A177FBK8_9EURO|nr:hypothetical protein AYO21_04108 [Fonsecaea monophora]KAH0844968.1 hypothetical protein FOPE_10040 [Fonsecaea pedrosoi]OAG41644.1 hypothetical protein AYO21_04108 [Fonsecaea monophora]